ncbi:MAG: BspA family leucine-rich repeat surface protein, partial [Bacilli bacterium]|nr:BspA family leucine-rich repeat surface protein [Bacilli bacterium]
MKKTKAFTLVELLGVIVILGLIVLLITPSIVKYIKDSKEVYNESTLKLIYSSANVYVNDDLNNYPKNPENTYCVSLQELVESGKLNKDILTINTDNEIPLDKIVKVTIVNDRYEYNLVGAGECVTDLNFLMVASSGSSSTSYLGGPIFKNKIETIEFVRTKTVPAGVTGSWDVSAKQNGSIMAWYFDKDSNGLFELFIGGNGVVFANPDSSNLFQSLSVLKSIKLDVLNTFKVKNMSYMFYDNSLPILDLSTFDTSNVTDMSWMLSFVSALTLDVSNFDTSKVTDMSWMFSCLYNLDNLDLSTFDTSNVTDMSYMFYDNSVPTLDLSGFDTSSVTNMSNMFAYSLATTLDLSTFDTSNVTDMSEMFSSTYNLDNLDLSNFDTSNVIDMYGMFAYFKIPTLDLSTFDTSNVTNMSWMFNMSSTLTLDLSSFNTSNVTDMSNMFHASSATTIDLSTFDTSNVTDMSGMFNKSSTLTLDLSNFDTSNVTNMS